MNEEKLKIKFYNAPLKWAFTIFFLLWNLILLAYDTCASKNDFIILFTVIVSVNLLAILSFVLLSIFPRWYYIFDNKGVTFQNRKGKLKFHVDWDNINKIEYVYEMGVYPGGWNFEYKSGYKNAYTGVIISPKQAKLVYQTIPKVKEIIDRKHVT